jgi:hypothetical protein
MYTEKELNSLIADVEKEFTSHLAKAEESFLAKAEDMPKKDESKEKDEKKASEESKGESKKPMESEKPEDKGAKDQHQQDTSKDDKGQPMESKEGREKEDQKENSKPSEDPHGEAMDSGYDDEDMEHMHSMYSSMSKPELKAHHDTIRKCMDSMGLAKCEDGMAKAEMEDAAKDAQGNRPNGGPSDGEAAKAKTPACSDAQAMTKSEKDSSVDDISLIKSELAAAKAESEDRKKNLEAVESFLKKFVEKTAPAGKAITSLDIIAKTESAKEGKTLSKSEIDAKLLAKAKDASLAKSDRDAINSYYFSKNVETVRHLL